MEYTNDERYDYLVNVLGVEAEALNMVLGINGDKKETYDSVLWYVAGERDIDEEMSAQKLYGDAVDTYISEGY